MIYTNENEKLINYLLNLSTSKLFRPFYCGIVLILSSKTIITPIHIYIYYYITYTITCRHDIFNYSYHNFVLWPIWIQNEQMRTDILHEFILENYSWWWFRKLLEIICYSQRKPVREYESFARKSYDVPTKMINTGL